MYGVDHHVFQVLIAILPERVISYFDVQSKTWKELSLMEPLTEIQECYCVEVIGNYLYVAAKSNHTFVIFCYDIICDTWSTLQPIPGSSGIQIGCLCNIEEHLYVIYKFSAPYRYNIATNQWQSVASSNAVCNLGEKTFCNKAATLYKSCLYVLYGQGVRGRTYYDSCEYFSAQLYCFDPKKNVWEQKASTETPHFGSSLLVVKNNLYVAGGRCSLISRTLQLGDDPAAIEVYSDQENEWSVVQQTHIPPNNLGAVEIEGRIYFIINSFPVDSGITIPPGQANPVDLTEWENLQYTKKNAVLCYAGVSTSFLTSDW